MRKNFKKNSSKKGFSSRRNRESFGNERFDKGNKFSSKKEFSPDDKRNNSDDNNSDDKKGGSKRFVDKKRIAGRKFSKPKKGTFAKNKDLMRINKYLAHSGLGSRREVEKYITSGLVKVNGKVVTDLSHKIGKKDVVQFDGVRIKGEKQRYFVMNKPKGFITTTSENEERKTVMDLIKKACNERIYPVGRLDKNTTGTLLFTNDGDVSRKMTHPIHGATQIYYIVLAKPLTKADFDKIQEGIDLEDGFFKPLEMAYIEGKKREIGMQFKSGRNQVIRRVFEELGYTIDRLDRAFYAGLTKKNLKRGQYRELTHQEVQFLKMK
ncbi:MAG: rRNA pseudouridine synthase [Flavobacteriales bacterium]|jgi:23S rRNA pseudouridine2605 synthase|nr:rRNA pseudouridine synthase [Flavobacteriales bacterium]